MLPVGFAAALVGVIAAFLCCPQKFFSQGGLDMQTTNFGAVNADYGVVSAVKVMKKVKVMKQAQKTATSDEKTSEENEVSSQLKNKVLQNLIPGDSIQVRLDDSLGLDAEEYEIVTWSGAK